MKINQKLIPLSLIVTLSALNFYCSYDRDEVNICSKYSIETNEYTYELRFKDKGDTVFLSYLFVCDNGNYINAPDDSSDYAAFFLKRSITNRQVNLNVKDYREFWRDSTKVYNVDLNFPSDSTVTWYLDSTKYDIFDCLPNYLQLKCMN